MPFRRHYSRLETLTQRENPNLKSQTCLETLNENLNSSLKLHFELLSLTCKPNLKHSALKKITTTKLRF